jgi:hypothetical protein
MPLLRRRPLKTAAMVGGAGHALGGHRETGAPAEPVPTAAARVDGAASEANRIDALTKLKGLFDAGVLTLEQYDSERARLTEGI